MKNNFYIALDNIRSAENVGSILRTSEALGIDKVFLCGITPTPENKKVLKTSLGAEKSIFYEYKSDILELLDDLIKDDIQILTLELTTESIDVSSFIPKKDICLILGNEVSGVSIEVLKRSKVNISIPMLGKKESLNVSVAFGIAAYTLSKKL